MPSDNWYLNANVEKFLTKVQKRTRNEDTVKKYRWMIEKTNEIIMAGGFDPLPKKWTEETVEYLRDEFDESVETQVARWKFSILNNYLMFHGNTVIKDMDLQWPPDARIHVDWLNVEQALKVMDSAHGMERIIIHFELNLGLRRVEVLRLRSSSIMMGYVNVQGKGKMGGKPRTNPFHPDTNAELTYWYKLRNLEVERARAKDPSVVVPDALLIYERGGKLHPYKRTAIDDRLKAVVERTGITFTNHTLRRTFGRTLWQAGVPLETIRDLLGHEDTRTTIQYLGINMDDKSGAMNQLADFQKNFGNQGRASINGGRTGI